MHLEATGRHGGGHQEAPRITRGAPQEAHRRQTGGHQEAIGCHQEATMRHTGGHQKATKMHPGTPRVPPEAARFGSLRPSLRVPPEATRATTRHQEPQGATKSHQQAPRRGH